MNSKAFFFPPEETYLNRLRRTKYCSCLRSSANENPLFISLCIYVSIYLKLVYSPYCEYSYAQYMPGIAIHAFHLIPFSGCIPHLRIRILNTYIGKCESMTMLKPQLQRRLKVFSFYQLLIPSNSGVHAFISESVSVKCSSFRFVNIALHLYQNSFYFTFLVLFF